MTKRRTTRLSSRLALAFVAVAIAAVSVLAVLTLFATNSQVSSLVVAEQRTTTRSVISALAQAYRDSGGWSTADLSAAYSLAASGGSQIQVTDSSGQVITGQNMNQAKSMATLMEAMRRGANTSSPLGGPMRVPITIKGTAVGTATFRFPMNGLSVAQQRVRSALVNTVFLGALLASIFALVVAWFVSRRISSPLDRLTQTVRSIESGHRDARVRQSSAPGEVGELSAAFDRMADALDREDTLRRQLLADVAHELRTPITILQLSCDQMVDESQMVDAKRLTSLSEEVHRLGRLVQDLETLAAAEVAGLKLVKSPIDLATVGAATVDLLRPAFERAEVELIARLHPAVIDGDATRIGQVMINLLSNALKFSPAHGSVTLSVGASDGLARLEVTDEGPGVSKEEIPHLFERFWRGNAGRRASGSGIGLSVVSGLVNAHGGRVEVSSEPGHGARFTVLIPLR
jgi:two-component system sensor histidine kinase BaeS